MYYSFCTQSYLPWLEMLVRSIRRVDAATPIVAHFAGDVAAARRSLADVGEISIELPLLAPAPGISPPALLEVRARNWLAAARAYDFKWMAIMDADLLVRRSLAPLVGSMDLYDFAAVIRGAADGRELGPALQVSGALHVLAKSGIPILEEMVRLVFEAGCVRGVSRGEWFWDQACLAEAVLTSDLKIRSIPREVYLASRPFDPRAAIWNANFSGDRKRAAFIAFSKEWERLRHTPAQ